MNLQTNIQTYWDFVNYCNQSEWPEWVRNVKKAVELNDESYVAGNLPWVRDVFTAVKAESKMSMSDEN